MSAARHIALIGVASGWGAQDRGTELGCEDLRQAGLCEYLQKAGIGCDWRSTIWPAHSANERSLPVGPEVLPLVLSCARQLASAVECAAKDALPVVLGGDHSIAMGTWPGIARAHSCVRQLGLVWIDAHMDGHTPETTPSKAYHGMPLAALLGYGDPQIVSGLGTAVCCPESVVLIGTRSYEAEEAALLRKLGVQIYDDAKVQAMGFGAALEAAIHHVTQCTAGFGISLDVDVMDPEQVPGVGSPESGGLPTDTVLAGLRHISKDPRLLALEVVEYNPVRDVEGKTQRFIFELLQACLSG